jgi:hypothetical protein
MPNHFFSSALRTAATPAAWISANAAGIPALYDVESAARRQQLLRLQPGIARHAGADRLAGPSGAGMGAHRQRRLPS